MHSESLKYKPSFEQSDFVLQRTDNEVRTIPEGFTPDFIAISVNKDNFIEISFAYPIFEIPRLQFSKKDLSLRIFVGRYTRKLLKIDLKAEEDIDYKFGESLECLRNLTSGLESESLKKNYDIIINFFVDNRNSILTDIKHLIAKSLS